MAYRFLYLVVALGLAACAPEVPRDIYIHDAFDEYEESAIVEMIGVWNQTGQELIGEDLLVYKGRYADPDGWDLNDADDGYNVIYKAEEPDDNYRYIQETYVGDGPGTVLGLGLHHDIILYAFNLHYVSPEDGSVCIPAIITELPAEGEGNEDEDAEQGGPTIETGDCDTSNYTLAPYVLKPLALHEMGHFVGMSHVNDPEAVMYPYINYSTELNETDKRAFCCLYECVTDRYECDWSAVESSMEAPAER